MLAATLGALAAVAAAVTVASRGQKLTPIPVRVKRRARRPAR
ncbi:MAG: hypothetical protein ABW328_08725 [Ilumatobacteraceae bacterium]